MKWEKPITLDGRSNRHAQAARHPIAIFSKTTATLDGCLCASVSGASEWGSRHDRAATPSRILGAPREFAAAGPDAYSAIPDCTRGLRQREGSNVRGRRTSPEIRSLSPVPRGEGASVEYPGYATPFQVPPLTLTLSPEYRGEGTRTYALPWSLLLSIVIACLLSTSATAADWHWELSADRYKKMNTFERAEYDKAARLLETNQPAAAASEFEKFKVQFGDSPNLSYALFMRGYCLHQAKQRNAAIRAYQEVVDYFSDQTDDAAAALYFQGVAHFDNGDTSKALRCMRQLVDTPAYQKSPLAAGALRRLGDTYWEQKDVDSAVKYWRQAVTGFAHVNDVEYASALSSLTAYYIITRDYTAYENLLLVDDAARADPARSRAAADGVFQRGMNLYGGGFDRKRPASEADIAAEQKAFYDYLKGTKEIWVKSNDSFGYYERLLSVLTHYHKDRVERDRVLDEAIATIKSGSDKPAADQQLGRLCDIMREGRLSDRARLCVAAMTDRILASWKEHEILCDEAGEPGQPAGAKWKEALIALEPVEASPVGDWAARGMGERARIYKDALGEYEKAIALYERLNQPPATLWNVQDAYKRWGKLDQALKTLTEIENLFPDNAARRYGTKPRIIGTPVKRKRQSPRRGIYSKRIPRR